MPLDTSAAQAILAAARANPDVIWQMGMPLNRNGTLNTQAHLANQYIDYANRGYGAAPPDWNTFLQRANQGWTVTDAFNGRQAGDQFAYQNYYPTGPQGGTQQSGTIPSPPTPPSPPSVGPPGSFYPPSSPSPPAPPAPPLRQRPQRLRLLLVKIRSIPACLARLRVNGRAHRGELVSFLISRGRSFRLSVFKACKTMSTHSNRAAL